MDDAPCPRSLVALDPLERAMAYVELHAFETLSLDDISQVAQLSPYHFVRQFSARYGLSPMAFVRDHRMQLAARRLAADAGGSLVELAFDSGFETQEGFTRAFKRAFGVSPGRYRRDHASTPVKEESRQVTQTTVSPLALTQEQAPRRAEGFRVAGFSGAFNETNKAGIPLLWQRLAPRLPLPGQVRHQTYGVCWGEADSGFHYLAGALMHPDAEIPEGLEVREVPAQTYLVFRQTLDGGELHPQMQAAVREIWGERLPKCGRKLSRGPDLEVYQDQFEPGVSDSWVEWWIPIEV
jgi:AraC family transcriptional regulator